MDARQSSPLTHFCLFSVDSATLPAMAGHGKGSQAHHRNDLAMRACRGGVGRWTRCRRLPGDIHPLVGHPGLDRSEPQIPAEIRLQTHVNHCEEHSRGAQSGAVRDSRRLPEIRSRSLIKRIKQTMCGSMASPNAKFAQRARNRTSLSATDAFFR